MSKQFGWMLGFGMLGCMVFLGFLTLFIVGAIRDEGNETRQAMDEATSSLPVSQLDDSIEKAVDKGGDVVEKVLGGLSGAMGKSQEESQGASPADETGGKNNDGANSINPGDIIGGFFKVGQTVAKELDSAAQQILKMDPSTEADYGREIHSQIRGEQSLIGDSAATARLERLAKPFLENRSNKQISYTFSVIDDPQVNAFAHLGGFIYVNKGLLDFAKSDQELQFVIGHEIGHVDLGHCAKQLTYTARAAEVAGDIGASVVGLGYRTIALGYSEDDEFEADAYAFRKLKDVKPAAIAFLQRLAELESAEGHDSGADDQFGVPGLNEIASELDNHFKTHPPTTQRIKRLEGLR